MLIITFLCKYMREKTDFPTKIVIGLYIDFLAFTYQRIYKDQQKAIIKIDWEMKSQFCINLKQNVSKLFTDNTHNRCEYDVFPKPKNSVSRTVVMLVNNNI